MVQPISKTPRPVSFFLRQLESDWANPNLLFSLSRVVILGEHEATGPTSITIIFVWNGRHLDGCIGKRIQSKSGFDLLDEFCGWTLFRAFELVAKRNSSDY